MHPLPLSWCLLLAGALHAQALPLSEFIGAEGARLVVREDREAERSIRVVAIDGDTLDRRVLYEVEPRGSLREVSRPWISPDGEEVCFAFDGRLVVVPFAGGSPRVLVTRDPAYDPSYWQDPRNGESCIVYTTRGPNVGDPPFGPRPGETRLLRPTSGTEEVLATQAFDAGMSPDGGLLADGGGGVSLLEVGTGSVLRLNREDGGCNVSLAPDHSGRVMHLMDPHHRFVIRDRWDRIHADFPLPPHAGEWDTPRWSNHPDFATATIRFGDAFKVALIRIPDRAVSVRYDLDGSWSAPHLWHPQVPPGSRSGPLGDLACIRHHRVRAEIACNVLWTPIVERLREAGDREGAQIIAALEGYGTGILADARNESDPQQAAAGFREVAQRFDGHPLGAAAKRALDDPGFRNELAAAPLLVELERDAARLRGEGDGAGWEDPEFRRRNLGPLVRMVGTAALLRTEHAGTRIANRGAALAARYALPVDVGDGVGRSRIRLIAVVDATSLVPDPETLLPYEECLAFDRYRVERVLDGEFAGDTVLVGRWGIRNRVRTPVDTLRPGTRVELTLDRFDSHADLLSLALFDDFDDGLAVRYWKLIERDPAIPPRILTSGSEVWNGSLDGLLVGWHGGEHRSLVRFGRHRTGTGGELLLEGGGVLLRTSRDRLADAFRASGACTVQLLLTPDEQVGSASGRVLEFGTAIGAGLQITQEGGRLHFAVATERSGIHPHRAIEIGTYQAGQPLLVTVAYAEGTATWWLDAVRAGTRDFDGGGLMNWRGMELILGADHRGRNVWRGSLHAFAVWNRVLGDDEVRASAGALRPPLSR